LNNTRWKGVRKPRFYLLNDIYFNQTKSHLIEAYFLTHSLKPKLIPKTLNSEKPT